MSTALKQNLLAFALRDGSTGFQPAVSPTFMVNQMLKVGKQPIQLQLGARYYAEGPSGGPDWGLRFTLFFFF